MIDVKTKAKIRRLKVRRKSSDSACAIGFVAYGSERAGIPRKAEIEQIRLDDQTVTLCYGPCWDCRYDIAYSYDDSESCTHFRNVTNDNYRRARYAENTRIGELERKLT